MTGTPFHGGSPQLQILDTSAALHVILFGFLGRDRTENHGPPADEGDRSVDEAARDEGAEEEYCGGAATVQG